MINSEVKKEQTYSYHLDPEKLPSLRIRQHEVGIVQTLNSFGKNVTSESELEECISSGLHHPLFGPVYVEGIEPNDGIEIDIVDIIPNKTGYQCASRSSGILKNTYNGRNMKIAQVVSEKNVSYQHIEFPMSCSIGVIGAACEEKTRSGRTGKTGGNLDIQGLGVGSKVILKSQYRGGLLYFGDVHMLQGDGEISGVAIECGATIAFKAKKSNLAYDFPILFIEDKIHLVGSGETLEDAIKHAVQNAQEYLCNTYSFQLNDAYMMLGAIGNIVLGHATGVIKTATVAIDYKYLSPIEKFSLESKIKR